MEASFFAFTDKRGWSGGAMVLGKLPVPGRPTIWITVGQGPTALAVGAGGGCLDIFTLIYPFYSLSPSLWETARYRLKYCLKGPLNPKQPTNQSPTKALIYKSAGKVMAIIFCDIQGLINLFHRKLQLHKTILPQPLNLSCWWRLKESAHTLRGLGF